MAKLHVALAFCGRGRMGHVSQPYDRVECSDECSAVAGKRISHHRFIAEPRVSRSDVVSLKGAQYQTFGLHYACFMRKLPGLTAQGPSYSVQQMAQGAGQL